MLDGLSWFHMYSVPLLRKTLWMARQRERTTIVPKKSYCFAVVCVSLVFGESSKEVL